MFTRISRLLRSQTPRFLAALAGASALLLLSTATIGSAQPAPGQNLTVHLEPGWNNVAYFGPSAEPSAALAGIAGKYSAVWHWDAITQQYQWYRPDQEQQSDLATMEPGHCYWIVASEPADLAMGPPKEGSVPALARGWNNLVYTGPPKPVDEALAPLQGHYGSVYAWDATEQRFRAHHAQGGTSDLPTLVPYGCYWLSFS